MNMTAIRRLNAAKKVSSEKLFNKDFEEEATSAALKKMESRSPFHLDIQPYITKISDGLGKMGKLVGGKTKPNDITPGMLATFLSMKQSCEENVISHVQELNIIVNARTEDLTSMHQHQLVQLRKVQEMIKNLENRMVETQRKRKAVETNAQLLERRSTALLRTVRDLTPKLTKAEKDFFQEIRKQELHCSKWEDTEQQLRTRVRELSADTLDPHTAIQLTKDEVELCRNLLSGQSELLKGADTRVKDIEGVLNPVLRQKRLDKSSVRVPLLTISDVTGSLNVDE